MHPIHRSLILMACSLLAGAAQAHHPMDGAMPSTALQGLLSGLAHPVIAADHLLFLLAAGTLAGLSQASVGRSAAALGAFAAAGMVGTALRVPGLAVPLLEPLIGITLLATAFYLWQRRAPTVGAALLAASAGAGFLHGQAYGEAVIGAEAGPVVWYLAGLLVVQCGLLLATGLLVRRTALPGVPRLRVLARVLGIAAGAAGLWLTGSALFV